MMNDKNPLLEVSRCPYGAPQFDKIRNGHYMPAFREALKEARAEVDAIADDPSEPTFENTIERLEYSGRTLDRVSGIFFNLLEAESDDEMQKIAEEVSPLLTEHSMYVSLNSRLFERVRKVYDKKESLRLDKEAAMLLEDTYKSFTRNGAALSDEDKKTYGKYAEELSLLSLRFGKNVLDATNAYILRITDRSRLEGLPDYVLEMGAAAAKEKGVDGWVFTLEYPSYSPFMKYCRDRELRREMYMAYSTRGASGEYDNRQTVKRITGLR